MPIQFVVADGIPRLGAKPHQLEVRFRMNGTITTSAEVHSGP